MFVVNFGAHFRDKDEEGFRVDVSKLLDDMGKLPDKATVVLR